MPVLFFNIKNETRAKKKLQKVFLFFVFFIGIFFTFQINKAQAAASWYNTSWLYRTQITIDHTKVASSTGTTLTNFPVLISTTSTAFEYSGFAGGHVASSTGKDILFTSSDGLTKINHEIETYSSSTGQIISWVKVPAVSTTTDTVLYMYYGNTVATDQSTTTGVWDSNYVGVWHLPNGTSLTGNDSTSNSYNLTNNNAVTATSGKIDGAAGKFNGTSQYLSNASLSIATSSSITVSYWVNQTTADVQNSSSFSIGFSGSVRVQAHTPWSDKIIYWDYGGAGPGRVQTNFTSYLDAWTYVSLVFDASNNLHAIYLNGNQIASTTDATKPTITLTGIDIGRWTGAGYQKASFDDFRVSVSARSADWIKTEYNNQNSPSTFYSSSAEEHLTVPDAPTSLTPTLGNTQVSLSWTAPVNNGGLSLTDYLIEYKISTSSTWGTFNDGVSTTTSTIVTPLTNGTSYDFRVSAINVLGTSTPSASTSSIPMTTPDAPTSLTPTYGNTQVSLSWTAPVNNGGSAITDYVVDYKLRSDSSWSTFADGVSSSTSATVTGLANGLLYDFRVSAVNIVGQGSASASTSSTPKILPSAPTIGIATAGNATATISFSPLIGLNNWYSNSWNYRTKIIIDHTKVASSTGTVLTNFPVLVSTTSTAFEYSGFAGGHVASSTGKDILFTSSDGITKINHEIETYSSSTGQIISWVKVPTLSTTTDTVLYMYYGNTVATDQSTTTGVWDTNYKGVWHLPDGTVLSANDSTSNGNTGTINGVTATSGIIDGGLAASSGTVNVDIGTNINVSGSFTFEAWVYLNSNSIANYVRGIINKGLYSGDGNGDATIAVTPNPAGQTGTGYLDVGLRTSSGTYIAYDSVVAPTGVWTHVVGTWDGSNIKFYKNGNLISTTPTAGTMTNASTKHFMLAGYPGAGATNTGLNGIEDEARISTGIARSADWIKTEYNNQNSPSTFYSSTAEESVNTSPNDGGSSILYYTVTSSPGSISATSTGSPITVNGLTNGQAYTFTVAATNVVGTGASSSASNSVIPATVPDAPTALGAIAGNASTTLTWSAPAYNGGSAITDYVIEYKLSASSTWSVFSDGVSVATTTIVTGLSNGSLYNFRVSAVNVAGQGSASGIVNATPITVPSAPISIVAVRGNAQATITFSPPISDGGSAIISYTITSNPGSHIGTGTSSPIIVSSLTNGTSYTFTVTATNAAGTGPSSLVSNSVTPATIPDAPTDVSATSSNAQAIITFTPPVSNGGSAITNYLVTSSPGGITANGGASPITVTGLTNGISYTFSIVAINDVGTSSPSIASNFVTPMTVPGAPTTVTAVAGNTQATVSFVSPSSSGGSPITSYTVTSSPGGITSSSSTSPIIINGLTNGQTYTFTVKATNVVGDGPASSPSNSVTPYTVPDAPTGLTPIAGNTEVNLNWVAPVWNGGSAITDYVVQFKLSASSSWSTFADGISIVPSATVSGLLNGQSYDFRVSAVNLAGQGNPSAQTTAVPVSVPDAPTNIFATSSNAQATITFTAPFDEGSPITSYIITSSPGNISTTTTSTTGIITGLTNGIAYTFTVKAINSIGTGPASTSSNSVTPMTIPGAPINVSAVPGNTQATVSFIPPVSDGGSTILYYTITSSPGNISTTTSTTTGIVTGLTKGSTYTFTVTATNSVGAGPTSLPSNTVTIFTEPSAPTNLAATVLGSSINLSWSVPASNGGTPITDYIIEYQLSTGGTWSVFADGTSVNSTSTVTGLSNGTSYDFRVSAVNIIGQSTSSNIVTATPGEPAQVLIQSFPKLTAQTILTDIRITNEGTSEYEYQYTWCITHAVDHLCGQGDDVFSSTAAKLIQPGQNYDMTATSTVPLAGNYWFHIIVHYGSQSSTADQSFTAVATYPDAPTIGTVTPGNNQETVSFTPPVSDGGTPILYYTVTSNPNGISVSGGASPIIVNGLMNGTPYTFTVTATNGFGTSSPSLSSNPGTPATIPDSPTNITASAGNGSALLSWNAPLNNGGSSLTDYVIEYKLSSDSSWNVFSDGISTSTSSLITGLTNNLSYDFRVSAVNIVGQSAIKIYTNSQPYPPTIPPTSGGSGGSLFNNSPVIGIPLPTVPTSTIPVATTTKNNPPKTPKVPPTSQSTNPKTGTTVTSTTTNEITPPGTSNNGANGNQTSTTNINKAPGNVVSIIPTSTSVIIYPTATSSITLVVNAVGNSLEKWWYIIIFIVFVVIAGSVSLVIYRRRKKEEKEPERDERFFQKIAPIKKNNNKIDSL